MQEFLWMKICINVVLFIPTVNVSIKGMLNPMSLVSEKVFGESDVMFPLPPKSKSNDISGCAQE